LTVIVTFVIRSSLVAPRARYIGSECGLGGEFENPKHLRNPAAAREPGMGTPGKTSLLDVLPCSQRIIRPFQSVINRFFAGGLKILPVRRDKRQAPRLYSAIKKIL
jgi:hypothetical protein